MAKRPTPDVDETNPYEREDAHEMVLVARVKGHGSCSTPQGFVEEGETILMPRAEAVSRSDWEIVTEANPHEDRENVETPIQTQETETPSDASGEVREGA